MRDGRDIRTWMTGRFRDRLSETGVPVVECSGDRVTRLAIGRAAVVEISRWAFTAPIGAGA